MRKNLSLTILIFSFLLVLPISISAHPGRTNASGCHTNRKTGDYHCHESKTIEIKKARTESRDVAGVQARNEAPTFTPSPIETIQPIIIEEIYLVSRVIDGDTIEVIINSNKEILRLIGIDTPEIVDPRKQVQCFAKEASNKAKEILSGKKVKLETDNTQGERDKYNRLLRYVFFEDGTSFNRLMVAEGYAHEYTYQSNPYKYQQDFKDAERKAKYDGKGLWNIKTCNGDTTKAADAQVNKK